MGIEIPGTLGYHKLRLKGSMGSLLFSARAHRLLLHRTAVVVTFHRVDNRLKGNPIACTVDAFCRYLDFFERHFRIVKTGDVVRGVQRGDDLSGQLAITFDDGYLDNYENAALELESRGLPATFFIATGMIGSETQPWWDEEYGAQATWMNWDQVRDLHARGFEMGAHTMHHVDLGKVHGAEAKREIEGSKQRLEQELGHEVELFSYPYGRKHQITDENRELVRAAGLKCCFSAFGGLIRNGDNPFALCRSPVTPWHVSPEHLGFELAFRS
ncbi:MAG: polysaccharide deacetylase family protein [Gemmatimonadota bacterium]